MPTLVIVESPAKCKKIEGYLGPGYKCIASFGHIYEISKINDDFTPQFKLIASKTKYITALRNAMKKYKTVVLATDDDREGEAIAWHICRLGNLRPGDTKRIIFHEITKKAIQDAIKNPTLINMEMVNAQLGRQVLDRIVGFTMSPLLWKKFYHGKGKESLSAGRCQTPALRLVYENYKEIEDNPGQQVYETVGDFTEKSLPFKLNKEFIDKEKLEEFLEESVNFDHTIQPVEKERISARQPPQPFSTSSLQQKASNELHFSPKQTMQSAQKLYEGGYITYMRTDNKKYSKGFIKTALPYIKKTYDINDDYVNSNMGQITIGEAKKKEGAQEAHEAIRPTKLETIDVALGIGEKKLYKLIRTNTMESLLKEALMKVITCLISAPFDLKYKHCEEEIKFPGWMVIRGFDSDNPLFKYIQSLQKTVIEYNKIISRMSLKKQKTHYTEARLVQILEKQGIGRPSTFSSLISKIQERNYVKKQDIEGKIIECTDYTLEGDELQEIDTKRVFGNEKGKLVIQPIGVLVMEYLLEGFNELFVYEYTSNMENKLDEISRGEYEWKKLCNECDSTIKTLVKKTNNKSPNIKLDENHTYMISKYGPVIKYEKDDKTVYKNIKPGIDVNKLRRGEYKLEDIIVEKVEFGGKGLGTFKNKEVMLKKGKFGLYITHDEKNYSLKGMKKTEQNIKLEDVLDILLGNKSTNPNVLKIVNKDLSIRKGKYGPYIFYKTERMEKPKFISFNNVKTENPDILNWKGLSNDTINDIVEEYMR